MRLLVVYPDRYPVEAFLGSRHLELDPEVDPFVWLSGQGDGVLSEVALGPDGLVAVTLTT